MTDTKEFPTADVVMSITGRIISDYGIDGVYQVLGWMAGERLYTHQLPRVGREARPVLVALHPALELAVAESANINESNWHDWRDILLKRHGPTIAVPQMTEDEHERIDPLSELAERVPPDRIVMVGKISK